MSISANSQPSAQKFIEMGQPQFYVFTAEARSVKPISESFLQAVNERLERIKELEIDDLSVMVAFSRRDTKI